MKTEKKLKSVSLPEMAIISLTLLLLFNGLAYLIFTIFFKMSFTELFAKTWIILIFIPLIQGIIQSSINRNGILTIDSKDKTNVVLVKIEKLLNQREYKIIESNKGNSIFEFKTIWKRLTNINSGKVVISNHEGFVEILGKRNILSRIETKLRYDREL